MMPGGQFETARGRPNAERAFGYRPTTDVTEGLATPASAHFRFFPG
jgi:hypothetical protein